MITKIRAEQTIVINLPTSDIFAYVSNLENLSAWSGAVVAVKTLSPGMASVGTRVQVTVRLLGRRTEITFEVVEYEQYCHLTLKSISGVTPCLICYRFERLDCEKCSVTQDTILSMPDIFATLAQQFINKAVQRELAHDLLRLKDILEIDNLIYRSSEKI